MLAQLPDVDAGGGAPVWLLVLAIVMPVLGVIASAWIGKRSSGRESEEERELRKEISEKWEIRGQIIDDLAARLAEAKRARDSAVSAAEDAHAHRIAAEIASQSARQQEEACRQELRTVQAHLSQIRSELEILRGNQEKK